MRYLRNQSYTQRALHATVAALLLAVVIAGSYRVADFSFTLSSQIAALSGATQNLSEKVATNQQTLRTIIAANSELRTAVKRARFEQEQAESQLNQTRDQLSRQVTSIRSELSTKIDQQTLSEIVQLWQHRVARVTCQFQSNDGRTGASRGSAVGIVENGLVRFVTNKHVLALDRDEYQLLRCAVHLPETDEEFMIRPEQIVADSGEDVAYLNLQSQPSDVVTSAARVPACRSNLSVGERVVILGYPRTGSDVTVTATEGIVSGFEDPYFITSAKIEQGNSGGAAVLVRENCFIGMPTLAVVGRLESLARILPASAF